MAGDGTLTVGTDTSYAPAEFLAEDGKTPVGFDVDLSKALAAVFGLKENAVSSTFDSIIPSVGSKYDIGISSFTVTKERMEPSTSSPTSRPVPRSWCRRATRTRSTPRTCAA